MEKIIKELVDNKNSLSNTLRKLKVIFKNKGNKKIEEWIDLELNGYDNSDKIPEYRKVNTSIRINGIYLSQGDMIQFKGEIIPEHLLDNYVKEILEYKVTSPLEEIELLIKEKDLKLTLSGDDTMYLKRILNKKSNISDISFAYLSLSVVDYSKILNNTRNNLLNTLLEIKDKYPELNTNDLFDINIMENQINTINLIFENNVFKNSNFSLNSSNTKQQINN